jgi:integrase
LPLLGLYTGARQGELAPSVTEDAATGTYSIAIVEDDARGVRLKTASSRRIVPVHPELHRLGFLRLVDARRQAEGPKAALFPLLKPGPRGGYAEGWSKWFGRYIRTNGITNKARVFHSFRHSFKDALRAAGVSEDVNDALTGHSGGGVGRTYGAKDMTRRFGMPRLAEAVMKVEYPGLDLSHLPCVRDRRFRNRWGEKGCRATRAGSLSCDPRGEEPQQARTVPLSGGRAGEWGVALRH